MISANVQYFALYLTDQIDLNSVEVVKLQSRETSEVKPITGYIYRKNKDFYLITEFQWVSETAARP